MWQGALDKFAEAKAGKRGTAEVDDEFLAEIERWRELLARNLVLRNPTLRGRDVNWAVQQIIDRIVFLRICEARDLETFEQLRALLNGGHTYERLQELFRRADLRYNSGLFHFEVEKDRAEAPDTLTPSLDIDDKVLKDIIEHLYYPQSPYEFSVLPRRHPGPRLRAVPGQGDPPDPGPRRSRSRRSRRCARRAASSTPPPTSWTISSGRPSGRCWKGRRPRRWR